MKHKIRVFNSNTKAYELKDVIIDSNDHAVILNKHKFAITSHCAKHQNLYVIKQYSKLSNHVDSESVSELLHGKEFNGAHRKDTNNLYDLRKSSLIMIPSKAIEKILDLF